MMNKVLVYIKKVLCDLYYAYYVILENLYKVKLAWEPIVSVPGTISILLLFPLTELIDILCLYWAKRVLTVTEGTVLAALIFIGLYWLTTHYYSSIEISIERRFRKDSIYRKVLYGIIAIVVSGIIIYFHSTLLDIYLEMYKEIVKRPFD